ncbi:Uma2 family endonuclease [cf. Phormidesmis sp. LEGE 11477]|uniref:Uma2 family endonuclease n=1 Tax=cf. Phormidesmis sp. LEGE 11477 TaxID=1828680 RepID=UPI001883031D|nr:Uma2 family endonuclease [cf. Phormidesmis sp. LEGE 11477]MBE9064509.1 Uma2 family endonuclease [cf. Phormidesmis sp. LEGE 11477]
MVANSIRWTTEDLAAIPDDGGWKRYEIIDGELFVTRAPHIRHQGAASKISTRLEAWSEETGLGNSFQTPGVVFTKTDAVIPDVVWASKERLAHGVDESGHFTVAPELIVEILSAGEKNEQRDRSFKLKLYSLHGVREYWIVNWRIKEIEVYRREEARLQKVATLLVSDLLASPLLPGFERAVESIFPG